MNFGVMHILAAFLVICLWNFSEAQTTSIPHSPHSSRNNLTYLQNREQRKYRVEEARKIRNVINLEYHSQSQKNSNNHQSNHGSTQPFEVLHISEKPPPPRGTRQVSPNNFNRRGSVEIIPAKKEQSRPTRRRVNAKRPIDFENIRARNPDTEGSSSHQVAQDPGNKHLTHFPKKRKHDSLSASSEIDQPRSKSVIQSVISALQSLENGFKPSAKDNPKSNLASSASHLLPSFSIGKSDIDYEEQKIGSPFAAIVSALRAVKDLKAKLLPSKEDDGEPPNPLSQLAQAYNEVQSSQSFSNYLNPFESELKGESPEFEPSFAKLMTSLKALQGYIKPAKKHHNEPHHHAKFQHYFTPENHIKPQYYHPVPHSEYSTPHEPRKHRYPSQNEAKYIAEKINNIPDITRYEAHNPEYSAQKPKYAARNPKHKPRKPEYLGGYSKYIAENSNDLAELPTYESQNSEYSSRNPKYIAESPNYVPETPKHKPQGSDYSKEATKYIAENLSGVAETSKYKPKNSEYPADTSKYVAEISNNIAVTAKYKPRNLKYSANNINDISPPVRTAPTPGNAITSKGSPVKLRQTERGNWVLAEPVNSNNPSAHHWPTSGAHQLPSNSQTLPFNFVHTTPYKTPNPFTESPHLNHQLRPGASVDAVYSNRAPHQFHGQLSHEPANLADGSEEDDTSFADSANSVEGIYKD